jgi:hypothetical protein
MKFIAEMSEKSFYPLRHKASELKLAEFIVKLQSYNI